MKPPLRIKLLPAATALTAMLLMTTRTSAEVIVTTERVAGNFSTDGTFVFANLPSNSSDDLAEGKTFALLAGTAFAGGPIANLTDGTAQTNQDSVPESFFAEGTSNLRVQLDLGARFTLAEINSYSWHANARAPQIFRVYGAVAPSNTSPDFTAAAFQDDAALDALGYTPIATVSTPLASGGQVGVSITDPTGSLGTFQYVLFDMEPPVWGVGPRPTFYGEIDLVAAAEQPPIVVPLTIAPATLSDGGYDLEWSSRPAKIYNLRTSANLTGEISTWDLVEGNIATTPPFNTFNVAPSGLKRFYVVEEIEEAP